MTLNLLLMLDLRFHIIVIKEGANIKKILISTCGIACDTAMELFHVGRWIKRNITILIAEDEEKEIFLDEK